VFGWVVALRKAVVGCGFEKSSFGKVVVRWMEASLVELLWILKKSPHFQVGPRWHAHIWILPPPTGSQAWRASGGAAAEEGLTL
jgi:hypothetical protein